MKTDNQQNISTTFQELGSDDDCNIDNKQQTLYQCKLILATGAEFIIPMRSDGYIHATKLCQASNKRLVKWRNSPETLQVITFLTKRLKLNEDDLIQSKRGGDYKNIQGTWVHPKLGINLAQWCSPLFTIQVSDWINELMITGKVELGNEKSAEEIQQALKERLAHAEKLNTSLISENKLLQEKYDKFYLNHQYYLRRKKLYKLPEGKCIYIINSTGDDNNMKLKIGKSDDITGRISGFRTSIPLCKLVFLMYTDQHHDIERHIKRIYEEYRPNGREFIEGVPLEDLKKHCTDMATILRSNYRIETDEQLAKFNRHVVAEEEAVAIVEKESIEEENNEQPTTKRCGGQWHTSEEDRILPFDMFYKHKSHKDGHARLCKDCYAKSQNRQGYNEKLRRNVPLPEFDSTTHKWCNRCQSVKEHDKFYKTASTKNGFTANCKKCKYEQKANRSVQTTQVEA